MTPVVPPSAALAHRYGESARDRLYLLRPDGYVGFRCLASEASRLEAHLAGVLTLVAIFLMVTKLGN